MILLVVLSACLSDEDRLARRWCNEVAKCDAERACPVPEWLDDPRCSKCTHGSFYFEACYWDLQRQQGNDYCLLDSEQYEPILADCGGAFVCPDDAPPECRIDVSMSPVDPP